MKPTYKVGAGAAAGGGGTGVNFRGNIAPAVAVDEEVDDEVDTPAPHMQVIVQPAKILLVPPKCEIIMVLSNNFCSLILR